MPTPLFPEAPRCAHAERLAAIGSVWACGTVSSLWCAPAGLLKARNTRRHPGMAMSIVDCANAYEEVPIRA